ncbi:acyltransferase [Spiractinospora alimapuensis]|uniref:acyltransferase n=1 Tax=Spiractinospora alimapuensis TaxID=2820884 RepID=UPI001F3289BB|nr:acyltransferase [Spiractinospora alimapuensis]QVQ51430.1 acyltransferase [Spiractinospora alimapuensis]
MAALWTTMRRRAGVRYGSRGARKFAAFGPGTSIAFPPATIFGEPWIELGSHTVIGAEVTITAGLLPDLELGPEPVLRIGDGCTVGRGSHVVAHQRVEIGDFVFTGPYVYVTDQNHGYTDPATPVGLQFPRNDPVRIGRGCWIGANAVVLPGVRLGQNCVVAAGSVVLPGEYPDHSVLAGVPAKIVRWYTPESGWTNRPRTTPDSSPEDT